MSFNILFPLLPGLYQLTSLISDMICRSLALIVLYQQTSLHTIYPDSLWNSHAQSKTLQVCCILIGLLVLILIIIIFLHQFTVSLFNTGFLGAILRLDGQIPFVNELLSR